MTVHGGENWIFAVRKKHGAGENKLSFCLQKNFALNPQKKFFLFWIIRTSYYSSLLMIRQFAV